MYAILSHGGRQYRVSAGDRLLVDRLEAEVGSVVALEPILLTGGDGKTGLGKDLEGMRVAVTVVAHRRGRKLRIFKYKAKKRSRKMAGYRSDLTELRVESILAKGARLPKATATATATAGTSSVEPVEEKPQAAARAPRASTMPKATTEATSPVPTPTATATKAATVAEPPQRSTAKRVSTKAAAPATARGSLPAPADAGATGGGPSESGAAKPRAAARTPKVPPKAGKRGATTKDKETRDGA